MRLLIAELGNLTQAMFAKHAQINRSGKREQTLIGANIAGGAFTFDMLFARCEREDVGTLPAIINRFANETPCHLVDEILARREKADAGSAIPHWDAQRLTIAHDDIRTHRARSLEHRQRSGICDDANQRALCMNSVDEFGVIVNASEEIRILDDNEASVFIDLIRKRLRTQTDS